MDAGTAAQKPSGHNEFAITDLFLMLGMDVNMIQTCIDYNFFTMLWTKAEVLYLRTEFAITDSFLMLGMDNYMIRTCIDCHVNHLFSSVNVTYHNIPASSLLIFVLSLKVMQFPCVLSICHVVLDNSFYWPVKFVSQAIRI